MIGVTWSSPSFAGTWPAPTVRKPLQNFSPVSISNFANSSLPLVLGGRVINLLGRPWCPTVLDEWNSTQVKETTFTNIKHHKTHFFWGPYCCCSMTGPPWYLLTPRGSRPTETLPFNPFGSGPTYNWWLTPPCGDLSLPFQGWRNKKSPGLRTGV